MTYEEYYIENLRGLLEDYEDWEKWMYDYMNDVKEDLYY